MAARRQAIDMSLASPLRPTEEDVDLGVLEEDDDAYDDEDEVIVNPERRLAAAEPLPFIPCCFPGCKHLSLIHISEPTRPY